MIFAVLVGVAGSFLPAMRAARLPVLAALRSV
jgi:ABC-type lipoprotein release transport system permease subunit